MIYLDTQKRINDLMKENIWIQSYEATPEEKQKRIREHERILRCVVGELITIWPHWSDESFKVLVIENQSQSGITCLVNGVLKVVGPIDFFFDDEIPKKEIDIMGWFNSLNLAASSVCSVQVNPRPKKLSGKWTAEFYDDFEKSTSVKFTTNKNRISKTKV